MADGSVADEGSVDEGVVDEGLVDEGVDDGVLTGDLSMIGDNKRVDTYMITSNLTNDDIELAIPHRASYSPRRRSR